MRKTIYQLFGQLYLIVRFRLIRRIDLIIGRDVVFESPVQCLITSPTKIGDFTRINGAIAIRGDSSVSIGKYSAIGANIRIISSNHDTRKANLQIHFQRKHKWGDLILSRGEVVIGNNVWLGDSAIILSGVNIGDGAVIGSGAVVTRDIPPFSIAVGVPATVIKKRFSDKIISQLLKIRWWDWPEEKIKRNHAFFLRDLTIDPNLDLSTIIR